MAWDFSKPEKENNTKINKWDFSKPAYELAPTVPRQEVEIPAPTITPSYTPLAQMKDIARGTMPDISKMPELPAPEPSVSQKAIEALARATREAKVSPEFERQYGWLQQAGKPVTSVGEKLVIAPPDMVTGKTPDIPPTDLSRLPSRVSGIEPQADIQKGILERIRDYAGATITPIEPESVGRKGEQLKAEPAADLRRLPSRVSGVETPDLEMSQLFQKPVSELSPGQKITEKTVQSIGEVLGYIPIGTIETLKLPEIVTKFTGESPDKYKQEAENATQRYAKVVGSIIPYFAVGGVVSGPVSKTTSSILSKVAPKIAEGFAGRVIPAVAGSGALGGIVSAYQQVVGALTQPEEFTLADAAKDIGEDIVRFGMFGLVSSGLGAPVREGILKALPEAMKQGVVTWNLSNLLAAATGGSITGASIGAVNVALNYLKNPEEFDKAQAMGDVLSTTLFFAGLDLLFALKTMATPSAWNWQYGKQSGTQEGPKAAKTPRPEGYNFAAHESEFKNNNAMFISGTWNPAKAGYAEIKEGYGVWVKPGTGKQRYEMVSVGEWFVPKHEAVRKGVMDAVIKTAESMVKQPMAETKMLPEAPAEPSTVPGAVMPEAPAPAPEAITEPPVKAEAPAKLVELPSAEVPAVAGVTEQVIPAKTPEAVPEAIQLPEAAKEVSPEERRKSLALRAEVEQLTPEEKDEVIRDLRTAHFTDELTGLKNKAAYMADEKQPFQAFIDLDNLKWVNDNIGHGAGDTLIKTFAEALPEGAYHLSGDEFVIQGKSEEELSSFLSRLETQLGKQVVRLEGDKKSIDKKGIGFSYGIGETLDKAETELKKHKEARLAKGERAGRGEVPKGIAEKPTVSDTRVKGYVPATLNTWGQAVSVRNFDYHATKEAAEKELEELKSKIPGEVLVVKEVMAEKRVIKAEEAPKETTTVKPEEAVKPAEVKAEAPIVAPKSLKNLQEQMAKVSPGKIGQEKAEALGALVKGVAAYRGLDPDEYVRQRFRGVVKGGVPAEDALFKRMESDDKNIPLEPASKEFVPPQKTVKAYKLFRTLKSHPNKIFPLFIGKTKPTPIGEWVQAEFLPTKGYAERPGWHAGVLPYAPHLMKKDGTMQEGRVWAEVELPADKDWQAIADVSKTRDIRDKVPEGGHYRFKTNKMQGDAWIIGGAIKVNRVLSPDEVRSILKEKAPEIQYKMVEGVPVASVEFDNDAKALIRALKSPNVAAMVHELGHVFRRDLTPGDLAVVEKWAGVIDGAWTKEAEEKFANGFEKYLLEGKPPTPNMKTVFEKFKQWLTEIYRNAVKLKVELSDSVRKVFDRMVGGKSIAKEEAPLSVKPKAVKPAEVKPEALKPPAKPELPKVEVEKDLPSTLKDAGFRTAEEAQLSFEAESMGLKAFKKEFPKLNKKILKQYTSAVKPEQAFKDLTDKIKNINKENLDEIKLDLQMFALKKLTPEERGQVKAFIKDTKKLLNKIPLRPEYKKEIDNLLEDVDWKIFRRTHKRIDRLEKTRDFLAKNPDAYMPKKALRELEILSKKPLADMSFSEIENMFGAVKQFARLSQLKDKLIVKQKLKETKKTVDEIGKEIETSHSPVYLKETRRADPKPSIIKQFHDLHKMVETLTFGIEGKEGGPLQKLFYNDFHVGVREETRLYNEAEDMLINVTKNYDIIPWSGFFNMRKSGIDWVKTPLKAHGKHIELTPAEVMGLYLHSKNEENKAAILEGGIKLRRYRGLGIIKVTEKQLNDTVSLLTKGQKAVADKMGEYLDTVQKDAMNKTSLLLTGNEVARVINYWRKAHPREELSLEEREMLKRYHSVRVLEDRGFLKQRTGSKAAIYLEDAFAQFVTSAKDGALYSGLAVPIRNARAILSNKEFVSTMEKYGLNAELKELQKYVDYIEGEMRPHDLVVSFMERRVRDVYASILGLNFSVTIKQPISYLVALTELDIRDWTKAIGTKVKTDVMEKYSPIAKLRFRGWVHPEMGEIAEVGEVSRFFTGRTPLPQKLTEPIRWADTITVGRLWNAVEFEVKRTNPDLKGDAFYQKVAEKWEDILNKTQVGAMPHTRSPVARSRDLWVRLMTMFSSQKNKNYNTALRSFYKYNASGRTPKDKTKLAKDLFITLIAQSFLVSAATALGQRVYKKTRQDDFVDAVKVISALLSNIYFIGPALDTIIRNVTKGTYGKWDLSDPVSSTLNEARDAIEDVFLTIDQLKTKETYKAGMKKGEEKWKVSALRTASKIFTTAGRFTGIPTYNIRIGAEATLKHAFPDTEFAIESYARNPQTAYYYDLFWDYLERGNEKRAEDMMKILVKDLGITSNGFRTSYKSRRDDLPEDIWEKATKIYTNTKYGKRG